MQTIVITGGTGLVGRTLAIDLMGKGYRVIILTRNPRKYRSGSEQLRFAGWNPGQGWVDPWAIGEADHIINLAGAGVAEKRWTRSRKRELVQSRVSAGTVLVNALKEVPNKVQTVVQASAIGWYGPDPEHPNRPFTESDPADTQFLGDTCRQWEASMEPVTGMGKRLVVLRIGIVLGTSGGALKEFVKPLRLGVAAVLGNGRQVISWIHIKDLSRMCEFVLTHPEVRGIFNAVAPHPETNRNLVMALARIVRGKWFIPVPVPALILKVVMGEMSIEVLKSATVSGQKIQNAGFTFNYPEIHIALQELFAGKS